MRTSLDDVMSATADACSLSDDLLQYIAGLLPPRSIAQARLVCRAWSRAITFLSKTIYAQQPVEDTEGVLLALPSLSSLTLHNLGSEDAFEPHLTRVCNLGTAVTKLVLEQRPSRGCGGPVPSINPLSLPAALRSLSLSSPGDWGTELLSALSTLSHLTSLAITRATLTQASSALRWQAFRRLNSLELSMSAERPLLAARIPAPWPASGPANLLTGAVPTAHNGSTRPFNGSEMDGGARAAGGPADELPGAGEFPTNSIGHLVHTLVTNLPALSYVCLRDVPNPADDPDVAALLSSAAAVATAATAAAVFSAASPAATAPGPCTPAAMQRGAPGSSIDLHRLELLEFHFLDAVDECDYLTSAAVTLAARLHPLCSSRLCTMASEDCGRGRDTRRGGLYDREAGGTGGSSVPVALGMHIMVVTTGSSSTGNSGSDRDCGGSSWVGSSRGGLSRASSIGSEGGVVYERGSGGASGSSDSGGDTLGTAGEALGGEGCDCSGAVAGAGSRTDHVTLDGVGVDPGKQRDAAEDLAEDILGAVDDLLRTIGPQLSRLHSRQELILGCSAGQGTASSCTAGKSTPGAPPHACGASGSAALSAACCRVPNSSREGPPNDSMLGSTVGGLAGLRLGGAAGGVGGADVGGRRAAPAPLGSSDEAAAIASATANAAAARCRTTPGLSSAPTAPVREPSPPLSSDSRTLRPSVTAVAHAAITRLDVVLCCDAAAGGHAARPLALDLSGLPGLQCLTLRLFSDTSATSFSRGCELLPRGVAALTSLRLLRSDGSAPPPELAGGLVAALVRQAPRLRRLIAEGAVLTAAPAEVGRGGDGLVGASGGRRTNFGGGGPQQEGCVEESSSRGWGLSALRQCTRLEYLTLRLLPNCRPPRYSRTIETAWLPPSLTRLELSHVDLNTAAPAPPLPPPLLPSPPGTSSGNTVIHGRSPSPQRPQQPLNQHSMAATATAKPRDCCRQHYHLQHLQLQFCRLSDLPALSAASGLTHLTLSHCAIPPGVTMAAIAAAWPSLEYLSVSTSLTAAASGCTRRICTDGGDDGGSGGGGGGDDGGHHHQQHRQLLENLRAEDVEALASLSDLRSLFWHAPHVAMGLPPAVLAQFTRLTRLRRLSLHLGYDNVVEPDHVYSSVGRLSRLVEMDLVVGHGPCRSAVSGACIGRVLAAALPRTLVHVGRD